MNIPMNNEMKDTELDFWASWRIRWVPRLILCVVSFIIFNIGACTISDLASARVNRIITLNKIKPATSLTAEQFKDEAKDMSNVCHAWLTKWAKTQKDSFRSFEFKHTSPRSGRSEMCLNWMSYAGERPNEK